MRNLIVRSISGLSLGVLMIGCIVYSKFSLAAIILLIMVVMMIEFYKITMSGTFHLARWGSIITAILLFIGFFLLTIGQKTWGVRILVPSTLPFLLTLLYDTINRNHKTDFTKISYLAAGFIYITAPWIVSIILVFAGTSIMKSKYFSFFNTDWMRLLSLFILIWASDIGAYFVGISLGKYSPKLSPSISPKKTWIGFWGGMLATVIASLILEYIYTEDYLNLTASLCAIGFGVVIHIASVYGDLFESRWKRSFGVKDSGYIIPGHGGMLDRFDSALFAIPFGFFYYYMIGYFLG